MPLLQEFKNALLNAIDDFSLKEKKLTPQQGEIILELKSLIEKSENVLSLHQIFHRKVPQLPHKLFYFLPFVNDLPKTLNNVLSREAFSKDQLLVEGFGELTVENKNLKLENTHLRKEFENFKKTQSNEETIKIIKGLQEENKQLKVNLQSKEQSYQEEIRVLTYERDLIKTDFLIFAKENSDLKNKMHALTAEKDQIATNYLQKLEENTQLQTENIRLKELLHASKQEVISSSSHSNFRFYHPSQN